MPDPTSRPHPVPIRPGLTGGACPERPPDPEDWLHTALHALAGLARAVVPGRAGRCPLGAIHQLGRGLAPLNDQALAEQTRFLRLDLHRRGLTDDLLIRAFALVSEIAGRTLGLRPYDTQLSGGWVLAHGRLAEMATGEGKTLTATLAAGAAALAGLPVHVITVNDYLVRRDAETTGPLYRGLGLSVAAVTADQDAESRRQGYRADVVYCTNTQLAFDLNEVPAAVLALSDAIDRLYWESIDRPKVAHWLAAYDLVASVLTPHPASQWARGLPDEVLAGAPKGYTDAVLDDEFPLSMFFEALDKKMQGVIASTAGITGRDA